jgi:hypothetical protein
VEYYNEVVVIGNRVLGAICVFLYYNEVEYGAIGGVLHCHESVMVVIGVTF